MFKRLLVVGIGLFLVLFRPEVCEGVRTSPLGDGCEVKWGTDIPIDPYYNYIAYDCGEVGAHVYTLFAHNPFNREPDDYILRWDFEGGATCIRFWKITM